MLATSTGAHTEMFILSSNFPKQTMISLKVKHLFHEKNVIFTSKMAVVRMLLIKLDTSFFSPIYASDQEK